MKVKFSSIFFAAFIAVAGTASAEVRIGVTLTSTGPGASTGIPMRNVIAVLPDTVGGQKARYIVLDDATDTTNAVRNARKLASEDKVDVIIGSSTVPTISAMAEVSAETKTPQIGLSPISGGVMLENPWLFSTSHATPVMTSAIVEDIVARNLKRVAYIGYSDSWGDQVYGAFAPQAEAAGLELTTDERYNRVDTSAQSQVLKTLAGKPDAVVIGASGNAATLPHIVLSERGFTGPIYHTHGVITRDFIRIGGKAVEGAVAPTGPVIVAEQLDDSNPIKPVALDFIETYENEYGKGSRNVFAGYAWDAYLLIDSAVPEALQHGQPGTPEFRKALRDAMEATQGLVTSHGIRNLSSTDRTGMDERSRVLVTVQEGEWVLKK